MTNMSVLYFKAERQNQQLSSVENPSPPPRFYGPFHFTLQASKAFRPRKMVSNPSDIVHHSE